MRLARLLGATCALACSLSAVARAEIDFKLSGFVSTDIRARFLGEEVRSPYPSQYRLLPTGFSRNENRVRGSLSAAIADRVKAVADLELVHYGFSDVKDIDSATLRERVDPYFIEAHAAYVDIYKILPGLDLRVGRQTVKWGAADQFNPTSNLNTLDLSDPLLFGRQLANNMVRADWNPAGDWVLTAVWVPVFRPAQLPRWAPLALNSIDRPAPVQEAAVRRTLATLATIMPPSRIDVVTLVPQPSLDNSQLALRLGGRVLEQDVSVSYYHGRFGIPTLAWTVNRPDGVAEAGVVWPRMDVIGADINGTIEPLGGMGYWIEGAVIIPQEVSYGIYNDTVDNQTKEVTRTPVTINNKGVIEFREGRRPVVVPSTPFLKLTVGADISIGDRIYLNAQYLHGFIDEFGAGVQPRLPDDKGDVRLERRIGDYLVAGVDFKFTATLMLRLFAIAKLPSINTDYDSSKAVCKDPERAAAEYSCQRMDPYKFTGVVFPQLTWNPWDETELSLGAFLFLGDRNTKFGDPSTGASEIFAKAKMSF